MNTQRVPGPLTKPWALTTSQKGFWSCAIPQRFILTSIGAPSPLLCKSVMGQEQAGHLPAHRTRVPSANFLPSPPTSWPPETLVL